MDVQSSSTLPFPPARSQSISAYVRSFTPRRAGFERIRNWRRVLAVAGILAFVVILLSLLLGIFLTMGKKTAMHDCEVVFTVSKAGKSHFRTISEAVDAAPNNSPFNICVSIQKGEYSELVKIGSEKTNLILIGGGRDRTSITSNASFDDVLRASTLRVDGTGFMAQDLSIISTADIGVAVDNSATNSIFFRCKLVGRYRTLHVKKHKQFYRDCLFQGGNIISEDASVFFQRCQFLSENLYHEKEMVFSAHSDEISTYKTGLTFHLCEFGIAEGSTAQNVLLGKAIGSGCSIVVMQCYLDEYLTGYFIDNIPTWNNTFFAIFGNRGPGANITVPPFVHMLNNARASDFSLRSFFEQGKWKPSDRVEYDLDLGYSYYIVF